MMLPFRAYAKVNLTLEVLRRRPDGYHDIVSVMQTIDLADTLHFEPSDELELACYRSELATADNLVLKAARLLQEATGCREGARILLAKGIPVAAGLGGGSSDAAVTLLALNRLWRLGLTVAALTPVAAQVGSDVPFFLHGGIAIVSGRGDAVTPLPSLPETWLVVVRPPWEIPHKTQSLYAALESSAFTDGEASQRLARLIRDGQRLEASLLNNAFEGVASAVFPGLDDYRRYCLEEGAPNPCLAGSGPSLFVLAAGKEAGEGWRRRFAARGLEAYLARTVAGQGIPP